MGIIYKLTSPSGKSYVGLTTQRIEQRMWKHKRSKFCRLLRKAIEKYGFDNMKLEILDEDVPNEKHCKRSPRNSASKSTQTLVDPKGVQ